MRRGIWGASAGPVTQEDDVKSTTAATTVRMEGPAYHPL